MSQKDLLLLFHLLGKSRKKLWRYLKDPGQLDKQLRISQSKFSEAKEATALALESAKKLGFRILNPLERAFPESLKCIPDPPAFLFVRGDVSCLSEKKAVALIGTRKPTDYGRKQAYRYGQLLAQKGWLIVSGLAQGCDTAAHQGCLRASGRTLVSGPNVDGRPDCALSNLHCPFLPCVDLLTAFGANGSHPDPACWARMCPRTALVTSRGIGS